MTLLEADYVEARRLLDDLNRRIDAAPSAAKPVFQGIAWLHNLVCKHEAENARSG
jgi:hypothetical protein